MNIQQKKCIEWLCLCARLCIPLRYSRISDRFVGLILLHLFCVYSVCRCRCRSLHFIQPFQCVDFLWAVKKCSHNDNMHFEFIWQPVRSIKQGRTMQVPDVFAWLFCSIQNAYTFVVYLNFSLIPSSPRWFSLVLGWCVVCSIDDGNFCKNFL